MNLKMQNDKPFDHEHYSIKNINFDKKYKSK